MRVFLEKSSYIEDIKFFQHKFRINCRAFTREQRSYMRNNDLRSWGTSILPWSGYADDLVLFLQSQAALQKATELLDDVFASFGLSINKSKTETMVPNSNETPDTVVSLGNICLKNVNIFKYLGANTGWPALLETPGKTSWKIEKTRKTPGNSWNYFFSLLIFMSI